MNSLLAWSVDGLILVVSLVSAYFARAGTTPKIKARVETTRNDLGALTVRLHLDSTRPSVSVTVVETLVKAKISLNRAVVLNPSRMMYREGNTHGPNPIRMPFLDAKKPKGLIPMSTDYLRSVLSQHAIHPVNARLGVRLSTRKVVWAKTGVSLDTGIDERKKETHD